MIGDHFFEGQLLEMGVDFILYEAEFDLHTHTHLVFDFDKYGGIYTQLHAHTLRLDALQTTSDMINQALGGVYILLYCYIFYSFVIQLIEKFDSYKKWLKFEIEYLSEVEKRQRNQKKPEFIRILEVIFDKFTIINMGYALLTFIAIIKYITFLLHSRGFS
jgi:hypothetical protein